MKGLKENIINKSVVVKGDYMAQWFKDSEFYCKCGCGRNNIEPDLVMLLDEARELANTTFKITSGCRCAKHNRRVGGSAGSSHLKGLAADIAASSSKKRFAILQALHMAGFSRIGIHKRFIHVDIDHKKPAMVVWLY